MDVSKGYYLALLDLIDKFFEGEIDQNFFEEYTRYIFVTDAYLLFTIDKLVHTMIKQVNESNRVTSDINNVDPNGDYGSQVCRVNSVI